MTESFKGESSAEGLATPETVQRFKDAVEKIARTGKEVASGNFYFERTEPEGYQMAALFLSESGLVNLMFITPRGDGKREKAAYTAGRDGQVRIRITDIDPFKKMARDFEIVHLAHEVSGGDSEKAIDEAARRMQEREDLEGGGDDDKGTPATEGDLRLLLEVLQELEADDDNDEHLRN